MTFYVKRYHDISCGHRVCGHESKCSNLHGHNYRIHFTVQAASNTEELDTIGRVVDFSVVKRLLCTWLDQNWDHKFLIYQRDPLAIPLYRLDQEGVLFVSFNPTAENIAQYLVEQIGPMLLGNQDLVLTSCTVEETAKCSATYEIAS